MTCAACGAPTARCVRGCGRRVAHAGARCHPCTRDVRERAGLDPGPEDPLDALARLSGERSRERMEILVLGLISDEASAGTGGADALADRVAVLAAAAAPGGALASGRRPTRAEALAVVREAAGALCAALALVGDARVDTSEACIDDLDASCEDLRAALGRYA